MKKKMKIDGINYEVGDPSVKDSGEVYKVSNRYYFPVDLFWCYTDNCYKHNSQLSKRNYVHGFVGKNQHGWFVLNETTIESKQPGGERIFFLNENIIKECGFRLSPMGEKEIISERAYASVFMTTPSGEYKLSERSIARQEKSSYSVYNRNTYSMKDIHIDSYEYYYKVFEVASKQKPEMFKMLNRILDKSIGVEFETSAGHLSQAKCLELGLVPLKDGSISGHEYVTLPYRDKVVDKVVEACKHLRYTTTVNKHCSTHVHVGTLGRTDRTFVVALYKLWQQIQEEMYELIVVNKRHIDYINDKKGGPKDHCKPVPRINEKDITRYYNTIFALFNNSAPANSEFNRKHGRLVHSGNQKWNITCRYYNLNMISLFENKDVIEFRIHGPTLNESKLVNYIFILNAIVEFAKKHTNIIIHGKETITLKKIISYIYGYKYPKIASVLTGYIDYRKKQYFTNVLHDNIWGDELRDFAIPSENCILALFGYNPLDNEYQKDIDYIKKTSNVGSDLDTRYTFEYQTRQFFEALQEEHDGDNEDEDDDMHDDEELFEEDANQDREG